MNVLLNNYCNQQCSYCFASQHLSGATRKEMTLDGFRQVLAFLAGAEASQIQLGGGEPTLHPQFEPILELALAQGLKVAVLTNGLFDERTGELLYRARDRLRLLFNINHPGTYPSGRWQQLKRNLARLTHADTFFGVNVHDPDQDLEFMVELCAELRPPFLRYVLAHSVGGYTGGALRDLEAARAAGRKIVSLTRRVGDDYGIRCCFDCGFVPCHFDETGLATLLTYNAYLGRCGLCPVVDEDLRVGHCFLRSSPADTAEIASFQSMGEVGGFLAQVKARYDNLRLLEHCASCPARALGSCDLGCVGDRIAAAR